MGLGAAGALLAAPAAGSEAIVDALGRRVVLDRPPRRIIPIFASNTELVVAAGLAERIVGVRPTRAFPARSPTCLRSAGASASPSTASPCSGRIWSS